MIAGLLTVGLLCLLYEVVLVGVLTLAQRREDGRRGSGREWLGVGAAGMPPPGASTGLDSAGKLFGSPQSRVPGDVPLHGIRASDAERQAGAEVVGAAMADGRLELDEGVDRLDQIFRARYVHELRGLVADLRVTTRAVGTGGRHRTSTDPRPLFGGRGLLLAVVVTAFSVQVLTGVWVLWPVAVAALAPFVLWRRPR